MVEELINNNQSEPTDELEIQSDEGLVKSFDKKGGEMPKKNLKLVFAIFLMVVLGIFTGYGLNTYFSGGKTVSDSGTGTASSDGEIKKGLIVGSEDESTFKDVTEGELAEGGVDGEGSHHLVRPGGESQNVYLTSSFLDLDLYLGYKVKVWGETHTAQKAGWLMDVGRLEVL